MDIYSLMVAGSTERKAYFMKKGLAEIVFIIDRSGSMSGLEDDTIGGFNSMLKEQQAVEGEARITTVLFNNRYKLLHDRIDIQAVVPLTREDYTVKGSTALLDAIGKTIHKIREAQRNIKEEYRAEKVMFIIITDGQENASHRYTSDMVRQRIEHQKQKYGWEFIFFGANMDAAAEAGKIGIKADHAQNYCADSFGTRAVYSDMSAMSTAFRTGNPLRLVSTENTKSGDGEQALEKAVKGLKSAVGGLKKSVDCLKEDAEELFHAAEANGGKIPDVNEILKQVLDKEQEQQTEGHNKKYEKNVSESNRKLIRKHWADEAVFTDAWCPDADEYRVPEEELLPGELSAVIFQVGCYTVRNAQKVYRVHEPGYSPELETPADSKEVELVRRDLEAGPALRKNDVSGLRITNEISARHNSAPDTGFTYICRAAKARDASWYEYIGDIYTVKENTHIPDEYASLLLYRHYEGSSFGTDTWYKLEPTGKITVLRTGAYGIIPDGEVFE